MLNTTVRDALYGENPAQAVDFRFHCETLYARSSIHRFEIAPHRHEAFVQLLYISTGEGDARLNGVVHAIRPPAIIAIAPTHEHGFRFSRDIDGVIVTVLAAALPASVQVLLRTHLSHPVLLPLAGSPDLALIDAAFRRILHEHETTEPGWEALCEGHIACLIALASRMVVPVEAAPAHDAVTQRYERLLALIAAHRVETPPTAYFAERLGISSTHLNRIVRAKSGLSLKRLVARRKIELARQELLFTVSPVRAIAAGLGFADPAYFSRFFLRETGMTPQAWREAERARLAAI